MTTDRHGHHDFTDMRDAAGDAGRPVDDLSGGVPLDAFWARVDPEDRRDP